MPETVNKIHGKNNRLSDIEHSYNKKLKDNSSHKFRGFQTVYLQVLRNQVENEAAIKRDPPEHSFAQHSFNLKWILSDIVRIFYYPLSRCHVQLKACFFKNGLPFLENPV